MFKIVAHTVHYGTNTAPSIAHKTAFGKLPWVGVENRGLSLCSGLSCLDALTWSDGSDIDPSPFDGAVVAPAFSVEHPTPCLVVAHSGAVRGSRCQWERPFICEVDCGNPFRSPPAPACSNGRVVPAGYGRIPSEEEGVYYRVSGEEATYLEGRKSCLSEGADLAAMDSKETYRVVRLVSGNNARPLCFLVPDAFENVLYCTCTEFWAIPLSNVISMYVTYYTT